jgi:integral membrane sensor domain MASE1
LSRHAQGKRRFSSFRIDAAIATDAAGEPFGNINGFLDGGLSAHDLNPAIRIVLRLFDESLAAKVRGAFAMPAIYGLTTASFVRSVLHLESTYSPSAALLRTLLSNATGLLLIAPVVILGAQYGMPRVREWRGRRIA